mmetsp:Transcript_17447/g.28548  ORF Transcript_17447/g.28548 Transcript_17447/m.28548 type:complete len:82 (-) Transcript_17447:158-403(-)
MRGYSNAKRMDWSFSSSDSANCCWDGPADEHFELCFPGDNAPDAAVSHSLFTAVDHVATVRLFHLCETLQGQYDEWSRFFH